MFFKSGKSTKKMKKNPFYNDILFISYWGIVVKKKVFIIFTLLSFCSFGLLNALAASLFANKLSSCSKYSIDDGSKIVVIMGWINRRCYYKEISSKGSFQCAFSKVHLYDLTNEIKKKNIQTIGIESLESGQKFLGQEAVCTVDGAGDAE